MRIILFVDHLSFQKQKDNSCFNIQYFLCILTLSCIKNQFTIIIISSRVYMISKIIVFIITILTIAQAGNQVIVLDDSNYTTFIQANAYVFVKFYAPWCEHCQSMIPEYQQLAIQSEGKSYKIAKVDVTIAKQTAKSYKIQGLPSLKFIVNGLTIDYDKGRLANDIQQFIQQALQSKVSIITIEEVQDKIKLGEKFIVFQGASAEQVKVLQLANFIDSSLQYYNLGQGSFKITLYLKDNKAHQYNGQINPSALKNWIIAVNMPVLVPLNGRQQTQYIFKNQKPLPSFMLLKNDNTTNQLLASYEDICSARKIQFRCSTLDKTSKLYKGGSKFLLAQEDQQVLAFINQNMTQAYKFPDLSQFSYQTLNNFLNSIKQGEAINFLKKQTEEKENPSGQKKQQQGSQIQYKNVLKLTEQTYSQILNDNKIVFIKYYLPYCHKCKKFAPEYEQLATKLKNEGSAYVIAAVDLQTQLSITQMVNVNTYPSFKLFINGHEIRYSGASNGQQIIKFIQTTLNSKLKSVSSIEEIIKPAAVVYGISQDSQLHLLDKIFVGLPIYYIESKQFSIHVYTKQTHHYTGEPTLKQVLQYLEKVTQQVVPNFLLEAPAKKVQNVFRNGGNILAIMKRDASGQSVFQLLERYCVGKTGYICGYAKIDDVDYEEFSTFLKDPEPTKSRLLYIRSQKFEIFLYNGDLNTLTEANIDQFLMDIENGVIKSHTSVGSTNPEEIVTTKGEDIKSEDANINQRDESSINVISVKQAVEQNKAQAQQL